MKSGMIKGLVLLGLGAFIIYWALTHSPKAGLGQMITNEVSGSYTMGEPAYYASLVVGTIIGVLGVISLYKSTK